MLYHDFLTNDQKPVHKCLHYFPIYERHFSQFVNQSIVFWEIGVASGGSLQMWKRFFGPFAVIIGIDINPICKEHEEDQIHVCIGDQSDTVFLQSIIDEYGVPDIVLDDGSHVMKHIRETFSFLYEKISKNGVYFVEDLQTAYWDGWGGGLKCKNSFIELCKDLIDSLNARSRLKMGGSKTFADTTYSMSFYDSIVVFEKKTWPRDLPLSFRTPVEKDKSSVMGTSAIEKEFKKENDTAYITDCYQKLIKNEMMLIGVNVAIYGSGMVAAELFDYFVRCDPDGAKKIKCFIEYTEAKTGCSYDNIPVKSFTQALEEDKIDTVIIGSYTHQNMIYERIQCMCNGAIRVIKVFTE